MNSARSKNSGCTSAFLLVWLVGWSAGTLFFDGLAVWGLSKQFHSLYYAEAPGIVTKSNVLVRNDSEGTSYSLELEYSYEVNGIGYTNDRRQYGFESGAHSDVKQMAQEYEVEKSIVVYHNPADPSDSVLVRGVSAMDFFLPLFLIPFNLIMITVFSFTIGSHLRSWMSDRPVTIKVRQREMSWFVKVYRFLPIAAAGAAAFGLSFLLIFVVGFGQLLLPAWILVAPAWIIVFVGTLYAYVKTVPTVRVELDEYHQRLTLRFPGGTNPEPTNLTNIQSIDMRDDTIIFKTESKPLKIVCSSKGDAEWLQGWLQARISRLG